MAAAAAAAAGGGPLFLDSLDFFGSMEGLLV